MRAWLVTIATATLAALLLQAGSPSACAAPPVTLSSAR